MNYIDLKILILFFLLSLIINLIFLKVKFFQKKNTIRQIQDIHVGNPSRMGGSTIVLCFFTYLILYLDYSKVLIWCSLIIIVPAISEDFKITINPIIRLFSTLIGCLLLILSLDVLPQFDFGSLNLIFNNHIFQIVFFTLAMTTVINGQNIIDGTNGLSAFSALAIFASLLYLGFHLSDVYLIQISILMMVLITGFLLFNYPFGYIFLGDTGSYFLGTVSSYFVIKTFALYPELPAWSAVTILFYPTLEVVFSYFRKIFQKKSPLYPDNLHLHLKIYYLITKDRNKSRLYNSLVTPFLGVVWLSPLALLPFSIQHPLWSILIVIFLMLIYFFFYFAIPNPKK